jgi:hypothetical protein
MARQWGYEPPGAAVAAVPSPAILQAGYRRGRFGRAGVVGLVGFIVLMLGGRTVLDPVGPRPGLVLVGWSVILDMLELRGQALPAFRLVLGGLWVALPLWVATGAFRRGPWWRPLANLAVGLAGLVAAVPVLTVAGVLLANLLLWSLAVVFGLLLFMALLLRILTAPVRRWW